MPNYQDGDQHFPGVVFPDDQDALLASKVTPLMVAAYHGEFERACVLLKADEQCVNRRNTSGVTALHYAVDSNQVKIVDLLLAYGAELGDTDDNGQSMLHTSVACNLLEKVETCVQIGVNIDMCNKNGDTALIIAARNGNLDIAKCLIGNGCDITIRNKDDFNAAQCAFFGGNEHLLKYLQDAVKEVKHGDTESQMLQSCCDGDIYRVDHLISKYGLKMVNFKHKEHESVGPFFVACEQGHLLIAQTLKHYGAFVNMPSESLLTPLMVAVRKGYTKIVEWLLSVGARVNVMSAELQTALQYAISRGKFDIFKLLLENGAMLNIKSEVSYPAIHLAVLHHQFDMVECLLQHGVPADITRKNGITPMLHAVEEEDMRIIECLIKYGADVNRYDQLTRSPLLVAVQRGSVVVTRYLVEHGADVLIPTPFGLTLKDFATIGSSPDIQRVVCSAQPRPFLRLGQCSVQKRFFQECQSGTGSLSTLEDLVKAGACVNDRDTDGRTALMLAAKGSQKIQVKWLIEKGADVNAKDSEGRTLLLDAIENRHTGLVEQLVNETATPELDLLCSDRYGTDALSNCININSPSSLDIAKLLIMYGRTRGLTDMYMAGLLQKCILCDNVLMFQFLLDLSSSFTGMISTDIVITVSLCPNRDLVKAFVANVLRQNDYIRYLKVAVRFCIANECHDALELIVDMCHVVSDLFFNNGELWCCHDPLVSELTADFMCKTLCPEVGEQIKFFKMAIKLGLTETSLKQLVLLKQDAFNTGKYATVAVNSEQPLFNQGSTRGDTKQLTNLFCDFLELVYTAVITQLVRCPCKHICCMSRRPDDVQLHIQLTTDQCRCFCMHKLQTVRHVNTFNIKYIQQQQRAYLLTLPKWKPSYLEASFSVREFLRCGSGVLLSMTSDSLDSKIWVITTADVVRYCAGVRDFQSNGRNTTTAIHLDKGHENIFQNNSRLSNSITHVYISKQLRCMKSTNVAVFELYKTDISQADLKSCMFTHVYCGHDRILLHRQVTKIGLGVDRMDGVIIDVNVSFQDQQGNFYHGAFVVSAVTDKAGQTLPKDQVTKPFAVPGDSGAAVVDKDSGIILGLIVASAEDYIPLYRSVTFCIRLDHALQVLYDKHQLRIGSFRLLEE